MTIFLCKPPGKAWKPMLPADAAFARTTFDTHRERWEGWGFAIIKLDGKDVGPFCDQLGIEQIVVGDLPAEDFEDNVKSIEDDADLDGLMGGVD